MATIDDFLVVDIRVGRIVEVNDFPEARNPSFKLRIDLGAELGVKRSVARLPPRYSREELDGRLVLCVVNLPPRQIGPTVSEVLTLGIPDGEGECILVAPEREVPLGGQLY
ncbi:MAG: tRNA-binding protein [Gemmatimonadota bacterium]